MKTHLVLGLAVLSVALLGSCKSQESAYRQAYEKAKAQQTTTADETTTVKVTPTPTTTTTPTETVTVTPVTTTTTATDNSDVRTIDGGVTVVNGDQLLTYSVVVGSFLTQANAEGLMTTLKNKGYASRVVKTNETINGHTGWFRVIASSFNDKASAVQSRNELQSAYKGAWLLYNK
ncbi:MAG: SPOR domain-containing protein [Bacteroidales bacterium]|nr:SPOR domain-containing protein [Bacteroidales bacterium]